MPGPDAGSLIVEVLDSGIGDRDADVFNGDSTVAYERDTACGRKRGRVEARRREVERRDAMVFSARRLYQRTIAIRVQNKEVVQVNGLKNKD